MSTWQFEILIQWGSEYWKTSKCSFLDALFLHQDSKTLLNGLIFEWCLKSGLKLWCPEQFMNFSKTKCPKTGPFYNQTINLVNTVLVNYPNLHCTINLLVLVQYPNLHCNYNLSSFISPIWNLKYNKDLIQCKIIINFKLGCSSANARQKSNVDGTSVWQ